MGILRVLLAFSVVLAHAGSIFNFQTTGGPAAVQSFYMISGFYMALVLNEKYRGPDSWRQFYFNRFLRIFPMYWMILVLTFTVSLILRSTLEIPLRSEGWNPLLNGAPLLTWLTTIWMNLGLFFMDTGFFMALNPVDASLHFTSQLSNEAHPLHLLFVVGPAWTLAQELAFYLIAPFLVRRSLTFLIGVTACSIALRVILSRYGLSHDPWSYRFFPQELMFFTAGATVYRIYRERPHWFEIDTRLLSAILAIMVSITLFQSKLPLIRLFSPTPWGYYLLILTALPFLFSLSQRSPVDQRLGEFSYPIYLCHLLVIDLFHGAGLGIVAETGGIRSIAVAGALTASIFLLSAILLRLDRFKFSFRLPISRT